MISSYSFSSEKDLNEDFYTILNNYYNEDIYGKDTKGLTLKDVNCGYIKKFQNFRDRLNKIDLESLKVYFSALVDYQIATITQGIVGFQNSLKSYRILSNSNENLIKFLGSRSFASLPKTLQSDIYRILGENNLMLVRYSGVNKVIKISNDAKKYFDTALKLNKNNSFANTSFSIWYLYSPRVAGGSPKIALNFAKIGLKCAANNIEKYLANIWISQAYFLLKNDKKRIFYLSEAEKIYKNGHFHKLVDKKNKNGSLI